MDRTICFVYVQRGGEREKRFQQKNPLHPHQNLQKALAHFKVQCRRIKTQCIEEGDEHHLATSYSQTNRLRIMGIENKQAAIEGMPALDDKEAKMITQAILAMRGINQKNMRKCMKKEVCKYSAARWPTKDLQQHGCEALTWVIKKIGSKNQPYQMVQYVKKKC